MRIANWLVPVALLLGSGAGFASDSSDKLPPEDKLPESFDCKDPDNLTCFNIYCRYEESRHDDDKSDSFTDSHDSYEKCRAASQFKKNVGDDGSEIEDRSYPPFNPRMAVECDGSVIYNNSAHRYTDYKGTRIQAQHGPYPAILLPKGALRDDHHYVRSVLELSDQTLKGYCYIYTGPAR